MGEERRREGWRLHGLGVPEPCGLLLRLAGLLPTIARGRSLEQSGDVKAAGLDLPLVELDLQQARQVPGDLPVHLQGLPGGLALVVPGSRIRPVPEQHLGDFSPPEEGRRVQGRSPILAAAMDVGPVPQQPLGSFDPAGQGRPHQGGYPEGGIDPLDIGSVRQGKGVKDSPACNTRPRSMAAALRASRS